MEELKREIHDLKESYMNAFEDLKDDYRVLSKKVMKINQLKKDKVINKQIVICGIILAIQLTLIIITWR